METGTRRSSTAPLECVLAAAALREEAYAREHVARPGTSEPYHHLRPDPVDRLLSETCMPSLRNELGTLLQERRVRQGFSRARVAEAVGISPGTIEGWEIGRVVKPPLTDVLRLARFLSIPLEDLEQAALADEDDASRETESKKAGSAGTRKLPGTRPLLEEAMRVMGWTEQQAAEFLQTSPEQIRAWRRRSTPLPVADVLALVSVVGARLRDEMRSDAGLAERHGA